MSTVWLPPLNSHAEYITAIRIEEEKEEEFLELCKCLQQCIQEQHEEGIDMLSICIQFKCTVVYYPENYERFEFFDDFCDNHGFPALLLKRYMRIDDGFNCPQILQEFEALKDLIDDIFQYFNLSWKFYPIRVLEEAEGYNYILEDKSGLVQKIMSALAVKANNWMVTGFGVIHLSLHIFKHVSISVDEYDAWVAWFFEKDNNDPNFRKEYLEKIKRPRTLDEIFYENERNMLKSASKSFIQELEDTQNFNFDCGKDCTICLENLGCIQLATKLPCSHVFHKSCIIKWLRQSHICPVCRFAMPNSFSG